VARWDGIYERDDNAMAPGMTSLSTLLVRFVGLLCFHSLVSAFRTPRGLMGCWSSLVSICLRCIGGPKHGKIDADSSRLQKWRFYCVLGWVYYDHEIIF
jgi:hypothetical protein